MESSSKQRSLGGVKVRSDGPQRSIAEVEERQLWAVRVDQQQGRKPDLSCVCEGSVPDVLKRPFKPWQPGPTCCAAPQSRLCAVGSTGECNTLTFRKSWSVSMKYRRRIYYSAEQRAEIWDRWQRGESMSSIGWVFDRQSSSVFS